MRKIVDVVCPKCGAIICVNPMNSAVVCQECGHRTEIKGEKERKRLET